MFTKEAAKASNDRATTTPTTANVAGAARIFVLSPLRLGR